jgi:phage-related protein
MRMQDFEIIFYAKDDGVKPAKDFLQKLEPRMKAKMYRAIDMLEIGGNELRMPYSKHLTDGIFELRAEVGNDISRVLYFFVIGRKAVLTNGFIKKTQEIPPNEIDRAKKYRNDYLNREENNI